MKKLTLISIMLTMMCSVYSQKAKEQTIGERLMERQAAIKRLLEDSSLSQSSVVIHSTENPVANMKPVTYPVLTSSNGSNTGYRTGIRQTIIFDTRGNSHLITSIRLQ